MSFDPITIVGMLLSWAAGWAWKKNPDLLNKMIPVVTLVMSLFTQIVAALVHAKPADAAVLGSTLVVGSIFSGGLFQTLAKAVLQWLIVTGTHSAVKNLKELPTAMRAG